MKWSTTFGTVSTAAALGVTVENVESVRKLERITITIFNSLMSGSTCLREKGFKVFRWRALLHAWTCIQAFLGRASPKNVHGTISGSQNDDHCFQPPKCKA